MKTFVCRWWRIFILLLKVFYSDIKPLYKDEENMILLKFAFGIIHRKILKEKNVIVMLFLYSSKCIINKKQYVKRYRSGSVGYFEYSFEFR